MLEEKTYHNSKIIIVKDKYPRIFRLNEDSLTPNRVGKKLNSSINGNDKSPIQQSSFNMYFKYKESTPRVITEKNTPRVNKNNDTLSQLNQSNLQPQKLSLPMLNIKHKIERGEEEQSKNSLIAQELLSQLKSQKNRKHALVDERLQYLKVYNSSDIKKNSESFDNLHHFDRSILRKSKIDQQEEVYQTESSRNNLQEEGRHYHNNSRYDDIKKISNSSFSSQNQYYFNRLNSSLEVKPPTIFSQLSKDSLLHKQYSENKILRLKKIQQINRQIDMLLNHRKHS